MCKIDKDCCLKLRELRVILAELVDEPDEIRMFVCDAGLNDGKINFQEQILSVWFEAIREAHKHLKLRDLVELVQVEFDENEPLKVWLGSFRCEPSGEGEDGFLDFVI